MGGNGARQRFGRFVIERAIQVAKHAQGILTWSLRHEPRDLLVISHEHDLFLVAFHGVENGAEVTDHVGDGKCLHTTTLSDGI